ncbi:islet cell autoantigen 1 isoform X3 [Ambystoma mexicanum]|uniref:islet cell autoantigen 1 isoform X3 n=1 Tax=Ambystoma mexicanum TaxID=8296 RepID=UPI0037E76622
MMLPTGWKTASSSNRRMESCSFSGYAHNQDKSVVNKMQQKYWKTKQTLIKVTGKKEDEHVVSSDADLDAKLELFHSIQRTGMELLKVIEQYQRRICFLSQDENELGKFLRSQGSQDKTRAGKMMQATGKALCFSSHQRLALRSPLCRLYQEVETFRYRAISDTWLTVNRMEQSRTEYRGALLWMKDVSQELDPDLYKQMEKYRKVQAQVRLAKTIFDKLKTDVCQKVDLLGASRCNLLSHVLTTYQTTLLHFWEKTSHTMAAIHESFKGYQPYEFTMLKTLQDPVNKLAEQSDNHKQSPDEKPFKDDDELISLEEENHRNESNILAPKDSLTGSMEPHAGDKDEMTLLNDIMNATSLDEGDFSKEWTAVFGDHLLSDHSPISGSGDHEKTTESGFLPSQLLDQNINMNDLQSSLHGIRVAADEERKEMEASTHSAVTELGSSCFEVVTCRPVTTATPHKSSAGSAPLLVRNDSTIGESPTSSVVVWVEPPSLPYQPSGSYTDGILQQLSLTDNFNALQKEADPLASDFPCGDGVHMKRDNDKRQKTQLEPVANTHRLSELMLEQNNLLRQQVQETRIKNRHAEEAIVVAKHANRLARERNRLSQVAIIHVAETNWQVATASQQWMDSCSNTQRKPPSFGCQGSLISSLAMLNLSLCTQMTEYQMSSSQRVHTNVNLPFGMEDMYTLLALQVALSMESTSFSSVSAFSSLGSVTFGNCAAHLATCAKADLFQAPSFVKRS